MRGIASLAIVAMLVVACGAAPAATPSIAQMAWDYAAEQTGLSEAPTGCLEAAPGRESEANVGCIWPVLFSGCHDGLTGEQLSPMTVEDEFPTEPGLQQRYHRAVQDCAALR
jgi:hypothetical protein